MKTARISEYRGNLSSYHKQVLEDREPLRIVGSSRGDVVVIAARDFELLNETIGILKDKATMNSLLENRLEFQNKETFGVTIDEAFEDVVDSEDQ